MYVQCIAENINIMGTRIGKAMKERDSGPIQLMANEEVADGADFLDLNIGPARKEGHELMPWIVNVTEEITDCPLSLDTTNADALIAGMKAARNPKIHVMNSISLQPERMKKLIPVAAEAGCNVVGLLWGVDGMPRDSNERAAMTVDLSMAMNEAGIPNEKILVDPITTPITLGSDQVMSGLEFMGMLPEIAPGVKSVVGLSNISNGVSTEKRPYLNRALLAMLMKHGIWSAIVDTYDHELIKLAHGQMPELLKLVHDIMAENEPDPSTLSPKEMEYYKTTRVLMGKTIFSESWLDL
ncbi:MAG: dihydropteroate synthase [Deltaproteobacteria bacterium]|nr:dihydropteroate synthase [Deltaproteobacteria bacterium]MBW1718281.1 dihydropteroate synthase [Deltaproteobacteria bacterium]MBW1931531.1 dihydropteroate synthase [Deltaproteobacteria bacterium]MBW1938174.1 dihydropteroate synthase [Deltaproteobacteria bacterium]MBW1963629.1 dihydropteroate synthase [Deltaproteobacteria bacterium]